MSFLFCFRRVFFDGINKIYMISFSFKSFAFSRTRTKVICNALNLLHSLKNPFLSLLFRSVKSAFPSYLEGKQLIRVNVRSANRAEIRLLGNTKPREILQKAIQETDDIFRFELVEPSMREIFVSAVTQQEKTIAAL